jgi:hypothetical protein
VPQRRKLILKRVTRTTRWCKLVLKWGSGAFWQGRAFWQS